MTKKYYLFLLMMATVLCAYAQPALLRTIHYTTHEGMASNSVNAICQDRQGYLWMGTNVGLTRFDGRHFVNFYREEQGQRVAENVVDIIEDTVANVLLVLTSTRYEVSAFSLERMCFETERTGSKAATTDSALIRRFQLLDPTPTVAQETARRAARRGITCKNNARHYNAVRYVTLPEGHEAWVTIDNGFYMFDAQTGSTEHFTATDPHPLIDSDFMSDILLDRSGCVWMTNSITGLYQLVPEPADVIYHNPAGQSASAPARSIRSFSQQPDGRVLVTNMDGDIFQYDLDNRHCRLLMHKEHRVYATLTDPQSRLWVATRGGGLWVDSRHLNTTDGLEANIIFHLFRTPDGTLWASTLDKGLVAAKEQPDGRFRFTYYLKEERVHQVDADARGCLWVATETGVFAGGERGFQRVGEAAEALPMKVVGICCTGDNRVLAATVGNGLMVIEDGKTRFLTTADGMANDCVKAVAWDRQRGIVAATETGITVIPPTGPTRTIHSTMGMMADNYNESAALRLDNGHILLGNLCGFLEIKGNMTDPLHKRPLSPVVTSVIVNDAPRHQQHFRHLDLPHNQNNIGLHFSCFDYRGLHSVVYSYRLEGFDADWRPTTKETTALYNNLPPGHYRFRLRAALAGQQWGKEAVCDIVVRQPWWWTWWARMAYLLAILLLGGYEWRNYNESRRLRRQLDRRLTALYAAEAENKRMRDEMRRAASTPHPQGPTPAPSTKGGGEAAAGKTPDDGTGARTPDGVDATDKAFLKRLDDIILPNLLHEQLDVAYLADRMCMSHSTLYRRIKSLTGMTASEYVRRHRLAKAMQLLRDGLAPTEVALQCGFNSPSYFTRCFKAEYGILPSEV